MLLTGKQIVQKKIIDNPAEDSIRGASYDLRVGVIIAKPFAKKSILRKTSVVSVEEYEIPPQGMVEVISLEKVSVPLNVLGYATVKTGLSDQCVLALGIGLIDPGYDSYLSSTLVNFGTQNFSLKRGDVFLRTTFHEFQGTVPEGKKHGVGLEEYRKGKQEKVLLRYSDTFLNLGNTIELAREAVWGRLWPRIIGWSAFAALVVTITVTISTIVITLVGSRYISAPDSEVHELRGNYSKLQDQFSETQRELETLRKQEQDLKTQIESQHQKK